jgi:hypothetical protein
VVTFFKTSIFWEIRGWNNMMSGIWFKASERIKRCKRNTASRCSEYLLIIEYGFIILFSLLNWPSCIKWCCWPKVVHCRSPRLWSFEQWIDQLTSKLQWGMFEAWSKGESPRVVGCKVFW